MNPFSRPKPAQTPSDPGVTESIAQGTKTMWKRSGEAISGMFAGDKNATETMEAETKASVDPLRLDHPAEISPEVLVANGRLWESTGNLQKAMENYTKALELEANYPEALTNIARLHFRQGNHTQAADFFGRAIKKNPEDAGLYNDLGLTLSKLGNNAAAEQTLSRALQLAPGTSRYANNLASVKFESGDTEGAFKVLEANNKPAVAHFNMAYLHYKNGRMQEAQRHLAQVMEFAPQAGEDASVKQAIDRSREMLAQLSGPSATIAQAQPDIPQAKASAGVIRQTSQSAAGDSGATISPANGSTAIPPAAGTIRPSIQIESVKTPALSIPSAIGTPASGSGTKAAVPASADPFALPPSFQMPTE